MKTAWTVAASTTYYRGMTAIVGEGSDWHDTAAVLDSIERGRALSSGGELFGMGIHWTSDRQVAESYARKQAPRFYPQAVAGPGGKPWVDPYYRGPRGTVIGLVLEATLDPSQHEREAGNVYVPTEQELTLSRGASLVLTAIDVWTGSGWERHSLSHSTFASLTDSLTGVSAIGYSEDMTTTAARTRRNERGTFADSGAVKTAEGKLPIYDCLRCGAEVCWADSAKTGRKYLVNVRRYRDHVNGGAGLGRWYDKSSPHNCEKVDAERAERQTASERLAMLADLRDTAATLLEVSDWAKVRAYFEWAVAKGTTETRPVDAWLAEFENVDGIINYLWRELS